MSDSFQELINKAKILYRRRYLLIGVSLAIMSVGIAVVYNLPKKYQADSTVFIEENVIKQLVQGLAITPDMDSRVNTIRYSLLSRDFLLKVLEGMDWTVPDKNSREMNDFIEGLQKRTDVEVKGEGHRKDLFTVSFVDQNPQFSQLYINALVGTFVEQNIFSKRQETYGANRFLDEQLKLFKNKLDNSENSIIEFRKKNDVFANVDEQMLLGDINTYQKTIEDLNLNLDMLLARKKRLESQMNRTAQTINLFSEEKDEGRVVQLQRRISQLLVTYTENYPEVVKLKSEIDSLKNAGPSKAAPTKMTTRAVNPLYQDLQQKIYDLDAEISATGAQRDRLSQLKKNKQMELQNMPEVMKQLAMLTQERNSNKQIYEQLLMRAGQSEVSKQMEIGDKTTTFRVVDPAILPTEPVSPDMVRMLLLVIAAGIGGGIGLILLLELWNPPVRTAQQLSTLGVAVLSVIPRIPDEAKQRVERRRDRLVYLGAGLYLSGVLCLVEFEFLKQVGKI